MHKSVGINVSAKNDDGFLVCLPLSSGKRVNERPPDCTNPASKNARLSPTKDNLNLSDGRICDANADDEGVFVDNDSDEDSLAVSEVNDLGPNRPDETILEDFTVCCREQRNLPPFTKKQMDAIKLMGILRDAKASLGTYNTVMEWHLKANGDLLPWEKMGGSKAFLTRATVFKTLEKRYNMQTGYNNISRIVLPSSKASVNIVWTDAKKVLQSLLTDPRITPNDYIFDGNNLFDPPQSTNYVGDLHTGRAYKKATCNRLITDPQKQMLLPTPLCIDGAVTGQFSDHEIVAVKISLGIFNRKARDRPHMWKTLGYMPPFRRPNHGVNACS